MRRVFSQSVWSLTLGALLACSASSQPAEDNGSGAGGSAKGPSVPVARTGTKTDLVVLFVTPGLQSTEGKALATGLDQVVRALIDDPRSGDLQVALVAGEGRLPAETLAGWQASLGAERFHAVKFAAPPKDALIVAISAGCAPAKTDFPEGPTAGKPRLCDEDFLAITGLEAAALEHEWLWDLRPVRGVLTDFLRADARRVYLFVSPEDAKFLPGEEVVRLLSAQSDKPVHALPVIAPAGEAKGPVCGAGTNAATTLAGVAKAANSPMLDLCSGDFAAHTRVLRERLWGDGGR